MPPKTRSQRERELEYQVRLLADALAMALSRLSQRELDEYFEGGDYQRLLEEEDLLVGPDTPSLVKRRRRWRETAWYKGSLAEVREWLTRKRRRAIERQKEKATG